MEEYIVGYIDEKDDDYDVETLRISHVFANNLEEAKEKFNIKIKGVKIIGCYTESELIQFNIRPIAGTNVGEI